MQTRAPCHWSIGRPPHAPGGCSGTGGGRATGLISLQILQKGLSGGGRVTLPAPRWPAGTAGTGAVGVGGCPCGTGGHRARGCLCCLSRDPLQPLTTAQILRGVVCVGGKDVDRGVWAAKTVKQPRQQPAHPPIRQLLGATDGQTAHAATSSTAPTHQPLGSANAETTPARAPAAPAVRTQRPDATCEGENQTCGYSRAV